MIFISSFTRREINNKLSVMDNLGTQSTFDCIGGAVVAYEAAVLEV